mmetsp:Transcript_59463/g.158241  ORF Transcript_59463/g.158241 Transcript_59463/m.158241 type:complete len:277 (-) Transcript_59463:487-1317(-)
MSSANGVFRAGADVLHSSICQYTRPAGGGGAGLRVGSEGIILLEHHHLLLVSDVALDQALVDEVGEHALHLLLVRRDAARSHRTHEHLEFHLCRVGVAHDGVGALEEVAVHEQFEPVQQHVHPLAHKELLVVFEGLVEIADVPLAESPRQRGKLRQPVPGQHLLGGYTRTAPGARASLMQHKADRNEVNEHATAVRYVGWRRVVEGERQIRLGLVELTVKQRHATLKETPCDAVGQWEFLHCHLSRKNQRFDMLQSVEGKEHLITLICDIKGSPGP